MANTNDLFGDFLSVYAQSGSLIKTNYTLEKIDDKILIQIENTSVHENNLESLSFQQHILNLIGEVPIKFSYQVNLNESTHIDSYTIIISENDYAKINSYLEKKMS